MSRSYSHLSVISAPVTSVIAVITLLKVSGYSNNYLFLGIGVCVLLGMILIGYLDVTMKVYEKEIKLNNKNNPQMRMINEINDRLKKIEAKVK
jgi:uncharacterized membrane protein